MMEILIVAIQNPNCLTVKHYVKLLQPKEGTDVPGSVVDNLIYLTTKQISTGVKRTQVPRETLSLHPETKTS